MEYRVLGPVEVLDGERAVPLGGYRQRLVLAVLLAAAGRRLSTDALVDAVWGERPPRTARKTMQVYLTRLRGLLGDDVVQSAPGGYRLAAGDGEVDAQLFTRLADRGHDLLAADPAAAGDLLREALAMWRGEPYGDLGGEAALLVDVQALRERRLGALADRVRADLDSGRTAGVLGELTALVAEHPRDEHLLETLLLAQYRAGRQAEALSSYESYRAALDDELGVDPSPDLQRLHAAMLRHDPALGTSHREPADDGVLRNPYKGLRPFGSQDGFDFFGRDVLVAELARRVAQSRLVTVVGPSGSGKSSAVLAGLVPALRAAPDRGWIVLTMVPGRTPFQALLDEAAAEGMDTPALAGDEDDLVRVVEQLPMHEEQRLVLVVDQLEELFEQVSDPAERERFLQALARAVQTPCPLTVLLVVRADGLGPVLDTPPLGTLVAGTIVGVVPLAAAELEAAAVSPARRVGVPVAPDLLAELVADMTDQPGALPQFEYALTEVFDQRDGPVLTLATYRALGGLRGVVARRAERSFQSLDPEGREAARQVYLRLVTIGEDGRVARRRVPRAVLEGLPAGTARVRAVLATFDRARLLLFDRNPVTGEATVEISHEALLREWPRVADWVAAAHDELRLQRGLDAAVAEWQEAGRSEDYLLTGVRLAQVEAWQQAGRAELTGPEVDYVLASRQYRDRAQQAEADRYARELATQRQAARRLRSLVAVVTAAALVATGLGLLATHRGREAADRERVAHVRELSASSTLALPTDPEVGVALALQAVREARSGASTTVAVSALHAALTADRVLARPAGNGSVAFGAGGVLALSGDEPHLVDALTGKPGRELPVPASGAPVRHLAASPDGSVLALGDDAGAVTLVAATTARRVAELVDPRAGRESEPVAGLAFSADGALLASTSQSSAGLLVWDVATEALVARPLNLTPRGPVAFDPDGTHVAVVSADASRADVVQIRLLPTGEVALTLDGHSADVTGLAYSPDGSTLVTASSDATVRFWDAATGRPTALATARGPISALAVDPSGSAVLTGTTRGEVTLWTIGVGTLEAAQLYRFPNSVTDVAFAPRGAVAAAASGSAAVTIDVAPTGPVEVAGWPASSGVVALSPTGDLVATVEPDGSGVRVVRVGAWGDARLLDSGGEVPFTVTGLGFDPAGATLAVTRSRVRGGELDPEPDHRLEIRRVSDSRVTARSQGIQGATPYFSGGLAFDPGGGWLAASQCLDFGEAVVFLDPGTLQYRGGPLAGEGCGRSLSTDASGERLAVGGSADGQPIVYVLDTATRAVVGEMEPHGVLTAVALEPSGRRLLTVGEDGTGQVWDVATAKPLHVLRGHHGPITAAVWSEDGTTVLTSGVDGTVRSFDPDTGEPGVVLTDVGGPAALALTPDGRLLVTVAGGRARVWAWETSDLVRLARDRIDPDLLECSLGRPPDGTCPSGP